MDHCYNTRLQSRRNRTFEKIDKHGRIVLKDGERIGKPLRRPGQTYEKIDRNGKIVIKDEKRIGRPLRRPRRVVCPGQPQQQESRRGDMSSEDEDDE